MSIAVSNINVNVMFDFHATALERLTSHRWIAGSGFDCHTGNASISLWEKQFQTFYCASRGGPVWQKTCELNLTVMLCVGVVGQPHNAWFIHVNR